jgi:hypothetical protein
MPATGGSRSSGGGGGGGGSSSASGGGGGGGGSAGWAVHDACEFLRKRRFDVPAALADAARPPQPPATDTSDPDELEWVLKQLGGLKERHRRALVRFVEQSSRKRQAPPEQPAVHSESDDEADVLTDGHTPPPVRGGHWPQGVVYSNDYRWDHAVPPALAALYQPAGAVRYTPLLSPSHFVTQC